MDPFTTPGAFSWSELMTKDPQAAAGFYAALFGWTIEVMDMPTGPYRVVKAGGTPVGGIMGMPPGNGTMAPNWCPYVTVGDVDATVSHAASLGGMVLHPPTDIPGVGRFAVIADPQGAPLNVMAYLPQPG